MSEDLKLLGEALRKKQEFHTMCAKQHMAPEQKLASYVKSDIFREIAEEIESLLKANGAKPLKEAEWYLEPDEIESLLKANHAEDETCPKCNRLISSCDCDCY